MKKRGGRYKGKKPIKKPSGPPTGAPIRVRTPREGELIGVVLALMGGTRLLVDCKDGKERMCRIPGKLRKRIWVREGDVVIIKPWVIEGAKKGDIVWRYNRLNLSWLKNNGFL